MEVTKSPSNEKLLLSLAVKVVKVVKGEELEIWATNDSIFAFSMLREAQKASFPGRCILQSQFPLFVGRNHSWIRRVKSFLINLEKNLS